MRRSFLVIGIAACGPACLVACGLITDAPGGQRDRRGRHHQRGCQGEVTKEVVKEVVKEVRVLALPEVDPLAVTGDIVTAGSSTVFPLSERMAERFQDEGYAGNITIDSIGSGAGL